MCPFLTAARLQGRLLRDAKLRFRSPPPFFSTPRVLDKTACSPPSVRVISNRFL